MVRSRGRDAGRPACVVTMATVANKAIQALLAFLGIMTSWMTQETPMPMTLKLDAIGSLPRTPASAVKKLGWRGVMRDVQKSGRVVVTHHDTPEAVILSASEYEAVVRALAEARGRDQATLDALRKRFDDRLKALQAPDAATRLLAAARTPVKLRGKVRAGKSY